MPTRNVVITNYQSKMIDRLVASGRYQNASEVLREGLRLLEVEESAVTELTRRADIGLAELAAGATEEANDALDRIFGTNTEKL